MDERPIICYDSLSEAYVTPVGAVAAGQEITFRVRLSKRSGAHTPRLLIYDADKWDTPLVIQPMTLLRDELALVWYSARFTPQVTRLLFYRFDVEWGEGRRPIMRTRESLGELGALGGEHWQLTVYDPRMAPPPALAGGLIYQIFPDRFYKSGTKKKNVPADRLLRDDWDGEPHWRPGEDGVMRCDDYFGGDLRGVRQKLPYLKSLGVTALYLNPIFEAHSNHRYNTADYKKVDPLLGTNKDFADLCAAARLEGIAVMLDGVFSHTGSDSVYFNREGRYRGGAYRDPDSPYRSWYKFEEWPHKYKSWWDFETLPEVNETNPDYITFIAGEGGVIDHWMKAGAGGWRLDVADELPDAALDAICAAVRRNDPLAPVIGEVWEDASNKVSYGVRRRYLLGGQLGSVMNYPLTDAILGFVRQGDAYGLYAVLLNQMENYPPPIVNALMNALSTHDIPRAITALAGPSDAGSGRAWQHEHNRLTPEQYEKGKRLLKVAAVLQYTLPGVPSLYYGDEAGMAGYRDPFNRACYPWGKEDEELLEFFRALGRLRAEAPCLADGRFSLVQMSREVFSYVRRGESETMFVAVNRDAIPCTPQLPPDLHPADAAVRMGDPNKAMLPGFGALILTYPTPPAPGSV